ncbi:MAG: hypothetical protein MJA28_06310 [Gammaproteobacteria bacterium]|nr:hypothetical protein [Gammaproteobacteria bacterium]
MKDSACFALAREGDWDAAINQAVKRVKDNFNAIEIASWLIDAGLSHRELSTEIDRVGQCLNPNKKQFFKLQEFWVIQQRSGMKDLFLLECMFLGLSDPPEIHQEEQRRVLEAQERELQGMLSRVQAMKDQVNNRPGRQLFGMPRFHSE